MSDVFEIPKELLRLFSKVERVAVLTGAGISAESGVPTFRGADGLWSKLNQRELASMDAFLQNPQRVWEWYQQRKKIMRDVQPNTAHLALVDLEKMFSHFSIATQNIDGLHTRAGSRTVYELHGNIERNRCASCGALYELESEAIVPPRCHCGGLIRPDVVWFGEMLPEEAWQKALDAARSAQLYISIGTSAQVYPAAGLPFEALSNNAFVVEINLEPTELTPYAHLSLHRKAGEILPKLVEAVKKERSFC
ncbi:MAG: NAD-dependent deacylase [candidate division KSB1 bacterium]|nr:NAD-dependent deacylase [candidate division KSB1 bacterium]